MNWFAQLFALVGFNLRTLPRARLRRRGGVRHRRRRGRARRRALDRRGLPPRDDAAGSPDTAIVLRAGADNEMTQRPLARRSRRSSATRPASRARTASRSPRPSCSSSSTCRSAPPAPTRTCRCAASSRQLRGAPGSQDRRGPQVRVGHERGDRRPRRARAVRRTRRRRRSCSSDRTPGRSSASSRRTAAIAESEIWTDAAVLAPAYHRGSSLSDRAREARLRRQLPAVQGRADRRSARQREGRARDRVLRRAIAHAARPRHRPRRHRLQR